MPLTPQQKAEFKRCQTDPHYFINTYVQIEHQKLGVIPFHMHGFQEKLLTQILAGRFNIVNKSRQCLPAGTMCDTPNGPVAVECFQVGDLVYSRELTTGALKRDTVRDAWRSGERQCVRVKLKDSRSLEVGENHPFLTEQRGWIKAGELRRGDVIVESELPFGSVHHDEDKTVVLAYLVTDGCTVRRAKFTNTNPTYLEEYAACAHRIFPQLDVFVQQKGNGADIYLSQEHGANTISPLTELCEAWGIFGVEKKDRPLPKIVFGWDKASVALLLNRMFAADGWVSILKKKKNQRLEIGIAEPCRYLLDQIKSLLKRFKINCNIYEMKGMKKQKSRLWKLRISHSKSILKFLNEIGIYQKVTDEHLAIARSRKHNVRDLPQVQKVERTTVKECFDISVTKNENFLLDGLVVHNTGISTLAAAYCLWVIIFFRNKLIMVISRNDKEAMAFVEKVKLAYDRLPKWMRLGEVKRNEHALWLKTGSRVEAEASGKNAGRSRSMYMLILDEGAHIKNIRSIQKAALPALSRGGGRCWIISTPNGRTGFFAEVWRSAHLPVGDPKRSNFKTFFCHWRDVPEYDQAWYDEMRPQFTDKEWAQEYEGDFLGSGDTVVPGEWLKRVEKELKDPVECRSAENKVIPGGPIWIWAKPKAGHAYIVGVDTARPDGKDFSAIQIIDLTDTEQVLEYQGRMTLKKLAKLAVDLCREYNDAYAVVESNSFGYMTANEMYYQLYYSNMFCKRKPGDPNKANLKVPGFTTSPKTRPLVIEGFRSFFMPEYEWRIYSHRLFDEATGFIWTEAGRAEADSNSNDDLVMSCGLALGNLDQMMFDSPADNIAQRVLGRVQIDTVVEYEELREALQGIDDPEARKEIIQEVLERETLPLDPNAFARSSSTPVVNEFAWLFDDKPNQSFGIPLEGNLRNLASSEKISDGDKARSGKRTFASVERT